MYSPEEAARRNPYYKRNHVGKVMCTLCNIYCNDEANFIRHLSGKVHLTQLERLEMKQFRDLKLQEEEKANQEAEDRALREEAARKLALQTNSSTKGSAAVAVLQTGRYGLPHYSFRTEHNEEKNPLITKVWLTFTFAQIDSGTRPLHRWISAREQNMEPVETIVEKSSVSSPYITKENNNNNSINYNNNTVNTVVRDYYVYLLVACDGYTTVALKFPSSVVKLNELNGYVNNNNNNINNNSNEDEERSRMRTENENESESENLTSLVTWDALKRTYSMYFVLTR